MPRRAAGYRHFLTPNAVAPLLAYLRSIAVAPLPVDVGEALAGYLQDGRPAK